MTQHVDHLKSHYGSSMNPLYMKKWGKKIAAHLKALIVANKYPILIYRGMSGVTAATAIAVHMQDAHNGLFGMIYVRKSNEKSHGSYIELSDINTEDKEIVWVVCDDFISTGSTVIEVLKVVSGYFHIRMDIDSIKFAVSLGEFYQSLAFKLNTLESALSIRHDRGLHAIKRIRTTYTRFSNRRERKYAESVKRQMELMKDMDWI